MAIKQCPKRDGIIHHSDRGIQYCSHGYVALLKKQKMIVSMTEENHYYENAMAERVNGILKDEFLLNEEFATKFIALKAVKESIETYNTRGPHLVIEVMHTGSGTSGCIETIQNQYYQPLSTKSMWKLKKKKKYQKKEESNINNNSNKCLLFSGQDIGDE